MIRAVILACALALPPGNFHFPIMADSFDIEAELKQIKAFIEKNSPGAEIIITVYDTDLREEGLERLPFKWRGMNVWIKRATVYQQIRTSA